MPVTARLSRDFYDKFGDKITDELVNWFNQVDATYRADLRELNELNFARFDAKLEQRVAYLDAKIDQRTAYLDAKIEQRAAYLDAKIDQRGAELREQIAASEARLTASLHDVKAELLKWMFGTIFAAWATLLGAMIALIRLG